MTALLTLLAGSCAKLISESICHGSVTGDAKVDSFNIKSSARRKALGTKKTLVQFVDKSLNNSRNFSRLERVFLQLPTMRPPGTPRPPLCEVSPNKRSRVCGQRDAGIKFRVIARAENLIDSTCRSIYRRAPNQTSCRSNPRPGRPPKLTPGDERVIFRAIVIQPKITAAQLMRRLFHMSPRRLCIDF
jgi:hypothetical protein